MPEIRVLQTKQDIDQARADLAHIKDGFLRAYARALNKSAEGTQTEMVRMAREEYAFKADAVRKRMWLTRATWTRLNSSIRSKGSGVLLSDFMGTRQVQAGLSVNVKVSTGRQAIKHAVLNRSRKTGKILSLRRRVIDGVRVGRLPIEGLYGPHPEVVWNTAPNWGKLAGEADGRLAAAFAHEVDYVLQQYGG